MMTLRKGILNVAGAAAIALLPAAALADSHMSTYKIGSIDDLQFMPMMEGSPVQMAVLFGDPATGPVGLLLRIPPGFEAPIHSHTSDYTAVMIEGSGLHWQDGEDKAMAKPVGKGGFWIQPGGQLHGDANAGDSEALAVVIFDGPPDFLMPE